MNDNPYQFYPEKYDRWYDQNRPAYLLELESMKEALPTAGVGLEIGVGTGRFAGPLSIKWGIDPAREMLSLARDRGVGVILGWGEDLPFPPRCFDYVVMVTVLCFLSHPDRVIGEAHRVLKEDGKIIIGLVDRESFLGKMYQAKKLESRFYREARFYSVPEVLRLFSTAGWKEIAVSQTFFNSSGEIDAVRTSRAEYGKGGFVVISGRKR